MNLAIIILIAYILGSINFSIITFKIIGKSGPILHVTGNTEPVNIYRKAGFLWAVLILFLDVIRALLVSVLAINLISIDKISWVGFALLIGNRFPILHHFREGKGVSTFLGSSLPINPIITLAGGVLWIVVFTFKRVPFIASFVMIFFLSVGIIFKNKCSICGQSNQKKGSAKKRLNRQEISPLPIYTDLLILNSILVVARPIEI